MNRKNKRKSRFVEDIRNAVKNGELNETFKSADIKEKYPGWKNKTYSNFLPKHRKGNPGGYTEYFIRHSDSYYSLIEKRN